MVNGIIGTDGQPLTNEEIGIENAKKSLLIIENFFHAVNSMNFGPPLRMATAMLDGMNFLNTIHQKLIVEIGPDEIEKMRNQYKTQPEASSARPN